jgi:hypothetical protein
LALIGMASVLGLGVLRGASSPSSPRSDRQVTSRATPLGTIPGRDGLCRFPAIPVRRRSLVSPSISRKLAGLLQRGICQAPPTEECDLNRGGAALVVLDARAIGYLDTTAVDALRMRAEPGGARHTPGHRNP